MTGPLDPGAVEFRRCWSRRLTRHAAIEYLLCRRRHILRHFYDAVAEKSAYLNAVLLLHSL